MAVPQVDLDETERHVLNVLTEAGRPLEVVELASATRLRIEKIMEVISSLVDKGVVARMEPEAIRERVEVDDEALEALAG